MSMHVEACHTWSHSGTPMEKHHKPELVNDDVWRPFCTFVAFCCDDDDEGHLMT